MLQQLRGEGSWIHDMGECLFVCFLYNFIYCTYIFGSDNENEKLIESSFSTSLSQFEYECIDRVRPRHLVTGQR